MILIITHTLPPEYGGADIAAFRYMQFLNQDQECALLLGYKSSSKDIAHTIGLKKRIPSSIKNKPGILINFFYQFLLRLRLYFLFLRAHRKIKLVHSFNSASEVNVEGIRMAKKFKIPVISEISLMGSDDPCTLSRSRTRNWKSILKRKHQKYQITNLVDTFVAKSSYIQKETEKCRPDLQSVIIPYFVDQSRFRPADQKSKSKLRRQLGIPEDALCIVYVGGINPRKGVNLLSETFLNLRKENKSLFLILVGPAHKYDQSFVNSIFGSLDAKASDAYLATKSAVENVHEYLMLSDLFVLPSFKEGFPISVLEAMSCRLSVVCSSIPEIRNVQIVDGENGRLFEKGSQIALESVLRELIQDRQQREVLAQGAYKDAIAKYNIRKIHSQYEKAYQLLSQK